MKKNMIIVVIIAIATATQAQTDSTYYFVSWLYKTDSGISVENTVIASTLKDKGEVMSSFLKKEVGYVVDIIPINRETYKDYITNDLNHSPQVEDIKYEYTFEIIFVLLGSDGNVGGQGTWDGLESTEKWLPITYVEKEIEKKYNQKVVIMGFERIE